MQEPAGREPLLILGASARAAAGSAARADFAPRAIDLFADADLAGICPVIKITDYPGDFLAAARTFPPSPWIYTGGLENFPQLVDQIAAERPLWGNPGPVLRQVRDPFQVAQALSEAGHPQARVGPSPLPGVKCLRKPRHSCGGMRITFAPDGDSFEPNPAWYFQEFVPGTATSAIYLGVPGQATLLGVTRQLIGEAWTGGTGFAYCGSIGPIELTDERRAAYTRIGDCLAERFSLRGLFGVDAIENPRGVFPVEVNPRYTASVEILERAFSLNTMTLHVHACRDEKMSTVSCVRRAPSYGKAVLYARRPLHIRESIFLNLVGRNRPDMWPDVADIPAIGTTIQAGQPVVTIFAEAATPEACDRALRDVARGLEGP